MFPIWIRDGKNKRPETAIFYELAANGFFLYKKNAFWRALVPVEKISILEEETPSFELFLPPIPGHITKALVRFFAWAYKEYESEAMMLLWWRKSGSYAVSVPNQRVSAGHISRYEIMEEVSNRKDGASLIGTVHSHGSMPAFHSGTDHHDEALMDGIHITIGDVDVPVFSFFAGFSISAEAAINGNRFPLKPIEIIKGIELANDCETEIKQEDSAEGFEESTGAVVEKTKRYLLGRSGYSSSKSYRFIDNEELLPEQWQPPRKWRDNLIAPRIFWLSRENNEESYSDSAPLTGAGETRGTASTAITPDAEPKEEQRSL